VNVVVRTVSLTALTLLIAASSHGQLHEQIGISIAARRGAVGARIKRAATFAITDGGQAQTAALYELAFVRDGQIFKVHRMATGSCS